MRKNIQIKKGLRLAFSSLFLLSASLLVTSCMVQSGPYSETDGVYYDPNTDTLPQGYVNNEGNQVGEYYNYQDQTTIEKSYENQKLKQNRYDAWTNNTDSDWGTYAGSETNYDLYDYPYYYGLGFNSYYYGNPYWSFGFNPYWSNFYNYYYGFYNGFYPFNGYYSYYYPYANYYPGYYNYYTPYNYKRSGENGGGLNNNAGRYSNGNSNNTIMNNGFRNGRTSTQNQNGFRTPPANNSQNGSVRYRNNPYRTQSPTYEPRRVQPNTPTRSYDAPRSEPTYQPRNSNGGGFRAGSSRSVQPSQSNGGGFRR